MSSATETDNRDGARPEGTSSRSYEKRKRRHKKSKFDLNNILFSDDLPKEPCAYQMVGCNFTASRSELNDHEVECQYGQIPLEHFHEVLQSKISEEEHNCRLIENIFVYLSYKMTDFIDLYMEKVPSPEGDFCSTLFTSQLFDAVKMSWRVSIKFTRVIEAADYGSSSLFSKVTFQVHQCDTSNYYNGRNPAYNKVAFYLTNTESSLLKLHHKTWLHEFSATHKVLDERELPLADHQQQDDLSNSNAFNLRLWLFRNV